jgi:hypothetical protein
VRWLYFDRGDFLDGRASFRVRREWHRLGGSRLTGNRAFTGEGEDGPALGALDLLPRWDGAVKIEPAAALRASGFLR